MAFPNSPAPTNGQTHTEGSRTWTFNSATGRWERNAVTPQQSDIVVGTSLGTTGTVDLNFLTLRGTIQTITLTGNPTFTTSNKAAGRSFELRIASGGSARTITWPTWIAFGAALPTSLASGKTLSVALRCLGTTEVSVDAVAVESA